MGTVVNTNIQALNSQRSLKIVSEQTGKASEKLSSGLRINRAGDDAAGLAISEKMRNQIKGLNQASRNSQDGISLIQTAEGALQESHDMLQRMRELVVQASNGTNTRDDRNKIALELNELSQEITSISDKTEFNTKKLINGDMSKTAVVLQTGANANQTMGFSIDSMNANVLGVSASQVGNLVAAGEKLEGVGVGLVNIAPMVANVATTITLGDATSGGTYDLGSGQYITMDKNSNVTIAGFGKNDGQYTKSEFTAKFSVDGAKFYSDSGASIVIAPGAADIVITGAAGGADATKNVAVGDITSANSSSAKTTNLTAIDGATMTGYTKANDVATAAETLEYVSFTGINISQIGGADGAAADYTIANKIASGEKITMEELAGVIIMSEDGTSKLTFAQSGAGTATTKGAFMRISTDSGEATPESMGEVLKRVDKAIETVSSQRAKLGAYQNRLEHTIKNLDTSSENLAASESRIRDTDMAKEMMNFTRSNVLSQAAQSMLAQANQAPNNILSLLR